MHSMRRTEDGTFHIQREQELIGGLGHKPIANTSDVVIAVKLVNALNGGSIPSDLGEVLAGVKWFV